MFNVKKISIRVDGNAEIGLGHIFRCISLAQILHPRFEIAFYCISIPDSIKITLDQLGIKCIKIVSESDFFSRINNTDIIVLDGYKFDAQYQIKIKKLGNKLVYIDDMCNMHYYSDLIINHAPGIESTQYLSESYTDFALGLDYCLLRPSFINAIQLNKNLRVDNSLVISFGGADINNITLKTLLVVASEENIFSRVNLVVGQSYLYLDKLQKTINNLKFEIYLYSSLDENEMCYLFLSSEYAIVPASGVLFESIACGCKPISGYLIDNQYFVYNGFISLNAIIDAKDFSEESISNAIKKIQEKSYEINTNLIDSGIKHRIIEKFNKL